MQNDSQRNYQRHSDNSRERASGGCRLAFHVEFEWKVVSGKNSRHSGRPDTRTSCPAVYREGVPKGEKKSIMRNPLWNYQGKTKGEKVRTETGRYGVMDAEDRKYML